MNLYGYIFIIGILFSLTVFMVYMTSSIKKLKARRYEETLRILRKQAWLNACWAYERRCEVEREMAAGRCTMPWDKRWALYGAELAEGLRKERGAAREYAMLSGRRFSPSYWDQMFGC